jgi:hypothetical protein
MPDDRTYGFNRDDAEALAQSISAGETWYPEIKPRGQTAKLELYHGVIIEQCDPTCSTYKVQRIHRYLIAGCENCGSGSGSGSGS